MRHRKADFISSKPTFIRCFGSQLRYANRECEQDFRAYEYHNHANLNEGLGLTHSKISINFALSNIKTDDNESNSIRTC